MVSLDRQRRISIVRWTTVAIIGMVIAYLLPEILGFIMKIRAGDTETKSFAFAVKHMPVRIVHIIGLVITGVAAVAVYRKWVERFIAPREGED